MNVAVWVVSGILAAVYVIAGVVKLALPKGKLVENPNMAFAEGLSQGLIRVIGAAEVAGGLGLILPWVTGVAPFLTPVAAVGLALLQVGATIFHGLRREFKQWPINFLLLVLAAFVAYERFTRVGLLG